jgi:hypothetical protein
MKKVISIDEILTTLALDGLEYEVCATAEATFAEGPSLLTVNLDCFLRPVDLRHAERHVRPDWLPAPQSTQQNVDVFEAGDLARKVFQGWVRKIRLALEQHHQQALEGAPTAP